MKDWHIQFYSLNCSLHFTSSIRKKMKDVLPYSSLNWSVYLGWHLIKKKIYNFCLVLICITRVSRFSCHKPQPCSDSDSGAEKWLSVTVSTHHILQCSSPEGDRISLICQVNSCLLFKNWRKKKRSSTARKFLAQEEKTTGYKDSVKWYSLVCPISHLIISSTLLGTNVEINIKYNFGWKRK